MQQMLRMGVGVIAVFSMIFLYYTNSFLVRRRQKEFGLYYILGMGKRNLVKIMICESLLTAAVSIAGGLMLGMLFSKLGELAITKLLAEQIRFNMEIDPRAVVSTVFLFIRIDYGEDAYISVAVPPGGNAEKRQSGRKTAQSQLGFCAGGNRASHLRLLSGGDCRRTDYGDDVVFHCRYNGDRGDVPFIYRRFCHLRENAAEK